MGDLKRFLEKNTIKPSSGLPLVHSSDAYHVKKMVLDREILTRPCEVFKGESLNYFFVGRPGYKKELRVEGEYWEAPACVILKYDAVKAKRVFPFDTGAFSDSRFPNYIQLMDMSDFEVGSIPDAPNRIIGSFFTDATGYFKLRPRNKGDFESRYSVSVDDEEVRALYKLILTQSERYDDRRLTVELQSDSILKLYDGIVEAVVHPEEYCESPAFMDSLEAIGAKSLSYASMPLKTEMYYHRIYETVLDFYKSKRWIK